MKHFLITGCGRSGTMGMFHLLNRLDVRTSFEEFFCATKELPERGFINWLESTCTQGEISGMAPPFLAGRESDITLLHQVRNPVAVIASLMGLETWTDKLVWPNVKFNLRWIPDINLTDDPLTKSMKYWLFWNQLVDDANPVMRYKAEDICPDLINKILYCIDSPKLLKHVEKRFDSFYSWNSNSSKRDMISWRHIPETPLKNRIREKAIQYGYTEDELNKYCPASCGNSYPCEHLSAGIVGAD